MYDFPRAGNPTMIITSFELTSLFEIFPSGDAFDIVNPGIFSVEGCGRSRGVESPEFCRMGILQAKKSAFHRLQMALMKMVWNNI
jgi:hypothetical protein